MKNTTLNATLYITKDALKGYMQCFLKYIALLSILSSLILCKNASAQIDSKYDSKYSFKYNFTSTCFDASVFSEIMKDYTVIHSEVLYIDNEISIYDFIVLAINTKRLMVIREVKGKSSFICVISDFSKKIRM